jgi:hypothetical protein
VDEELSGMLDYEELLRRVVMKPARAHLMQLSQKYLLSQAKLMDPTILCARTAAGIVVHMTGVEPIQWVHGIPVPKEVGEKHGEWIDGRMEESLEDLLIEDEEAYEEGHDQPDPEEPRHRYLINWFKIEPYTVLAAATRFNSLPELERKSFFEIFVQNKAMDDCLGTGLGAPKEIRQQAEKALRAIIDPPPTEAPPGMEDLGLL